MGDRNWENGYRDGGLDQESGKGKSTFVRPLKRLFRVDQLLPGAKNRLDSYLSGYTTGYEDKVRSFNIRGNAEISIERGENMAMTSSGPTGGVPQSGQSLENQLGWCITSRNYLESLQEEILYIRGQYEREFDELVSYGYLQEYLDQFAPMVEEFKELSKEICDHIENDHLTYINKQAKSVSEKLQDIQSKKGTSR